MDAATRLQTALNLLAVDPRLGGAVIRARVGPAYVTALEQVKYTLPLPPRRLHPTMGSDALDGSIDVATTLSDGALTRTKGVLDGDPRTLLLPMAERAEPLLVSRLCAGLDTETGHVLIAIDEGAEPDEVCPPALLDRLAFLLDLSDVARDQIDVTLSPEITPPQMHAAYSDDLPEQLVLLCGALGISSFRAASFALRAAQAHAALFNRDRVETEDIEAAVVLTLAPRATRIPEPQPEDAPPQDQDEAQSDETPDSTQDQNLMLPDEILLEAVKAALPPDLLASLASGTTRNAKGSGSGRKRIGNRRGRRLPPRGQRAAAGARVDMMATLRAAIPWQTMRRAAQPDRTGPIILPTDLRHKRYQELSDRLLIFTVDASGSAAISRLAEAKGAVELLLVEAYARRDHVTLIAFRGEGAETLLPPTRSLVQTKRRLADLPGGGGTPLAAGLQEAAQAARMAQQKGLTPTIVLLTDGRANVALDGTGNRVQAGQDAARVALLCAETGADAIVIDTGNRPERSLATLAASLRGQYLSLPRADAKKLSKSVQQRLEG